MVSGLLVCLLVCQFLFVVRLVGLVIGRLVDLIVGRYNGWLVSCLVV